MSPGGEVLWKHHVDRKDRDLVHVEQSTDDGATWQRFVVKTKGSQEKFRVTELRVPDPTARGLRELRFGALEEYLRQHLSGVVRGATARATASGRGGRVVLEAPKTPRYGAAFYERFAVSYRDCVARGLPPRATLAADAGVSLAAIARWTKEARRRGYLTPSVGMGKTSA